MISFTQFFLLTLLIKFVNCYIDFSHRIQENQPAIASIITHNNQIQKFQNVLHSSISPQLEREESVRFLSPEGSIIAGETTAVSYLGNKSFVLSGRLLSNDGSFYLSVVDNAVVGRITLPEATYDLIPHNLTTNQYVIRESRIGSESPECTMDSELLDGAANMRGEIFTNSIKAHLARETEGKMYLLDNPQHDNNNILDVMFIATPQALSSIGGSFAAFKALVALSVQMANDAYANTGSPIRMRTVDIQLYGDANYEEVSFEEELHRLRNSTDGFYDIEATRKRAEVGADAVVLFVSSASYCGLAYQWATTDLAYSVVSTQCPGSVAHEVGHNIGLNHERTEVHDFNMSHYNFGYCWDTSAHTCSRSVMAYSGCVTAGKRSNCMSVQYFSSPLINEGALGKGTGTSTADNARVLREQAARATQWMKTNQSGGLISSVHPALIPIIRCEPISIKGWRIANIVDTSAASFSSNEDPIVAVTLAGVSVHRILSQTTNSIEVLSGMAETPRTGDVVLTTRSGYRTTLSNAFVYQQQSGNFTTDFDQTTLSNGEQEEIQWESVGDLDWVVLRYCDAIPCDSSSSSSSSSSSVRSGPLVGQGGTGNFALLRGFDVSSAAVAAHKTGILQALFNRNSQHGCQDKVYSISLYYHRYTPYPMCAATLTIQALNTAGVWVDISTANQIQSHQTDAWLPLHYVFKNPDEVMGVRLVSEPYSGPGTCFYWGAVAVDTITVQKSTVCKSDGCDLISPWPTTGPTFMPSPAPSTLATRNPTRTPTIAATATPGQPGVELLQFTCTQLLQGITLEDLKAIPNIDGQFLAVASHEMRLHSDESACCNVMTNASLNTLTSTATEEKHRSSIELEHSTKKSLQMKDVNVLQLQVQLVYQINLIIPVMIHPPSAASTNSIIDADILAMDMSTPSPGVLSSGAMIEFKRVTSNLISCTLNGSFQAALINAIPALYPATVVPLSAASFSTPISQLMASTSIPTSSPTTIESTDSSSSSFGGILQWAVLSSAIVIFLLTIIGGVAMWKRNWAKKDNIAPECSASFTPPPASQPQPQPLQSLSMPDVVVASASVTAEKIDQMECGRAETILQITDESDHSCEPAPVPPKRLIEMIPIKKNTPIGTSSALSRETNFPSINCSNLEQPHHNQSINNFNTHVHIYDYEQVHGYEKKVKYEGDNEYDCADTNERCAFLNERSQSYQQPTRDHYNHFQHNNNNYDDPDQRITAERWEESLFALNKTNPRSQSKSQTIQHNTTPPNPPTPQQHPSHQPRANVHSDDWGYHSQRASSAKTTPRRSSTENKLTAVTPKSPNNLYSNDTLSKFTLIRPSDDDAHIISAVVSKRSHHQHQQQRLQQSRHNDNFPIRTSSLDECESPLPSTTKNRMCFEESEGLIAVSGSAVSAGSGSGSGGSSVRCSALGSYDAEFDSDLCSNEREPLYAQGGNPATSSAAKLRNTIKNPHLKDDISTLGWYPGFQRHFKNLGYLRVNIDSNCAGSGYQRLNGNPYINHIQEEEEEDAEREDDEEENIFMNAPKHHTAPLSYHLQEHHKGDIPNASSTSSRIKGKVNANMNAHALKISAAKGIHYSTPPSPQTQPAATSAPSPTHGDQLKQYGVGRYFASKDMARLGMIRLPQHGTSPSTITAALSARSSGVASSGGCDGGESGTGSGTGTGSFGTMHNVSVGVSCSGGRSDGTSARGCAGKEGIVVRERVNTLERNMYLQKLSSIDDSRVGSGSLCAQSCIPHSHNSSAYEDNTSEG